MFRKESGVTLVALVITIIVLLILAGVTITMALDENGIIAQANKANDGQDEGVVQDLATSAMAAAYVRKNGIADDEDKTIEELLVDELKLMPVFNNSADIGTKGDNKVTVEYNGDTYTITHTDSSITLVDGPDEDEV